MIVLYIENPQGSVKKPEFKEELITIGRAEDNMIVLPERNVSRHHLKIYLNNGKWMVADAGSRYGTDYREEYLEQPEPLVPNAYITVGDYRIKMISASVADMPKQDDVADVFSPEDEDERITAEYIPTQKHKAVEELDSDDTWQEEAPRRSKKGIIVAVVVFGLLAVGGAYFIFAGKGKAVEKNTNKKNTLLASKKTPEKKSARVIQKDASIKKVAKKDATQKKAVAATDVPAVKPVKKVEPPKQVVAKTKPAPVKIEPKHKKTVVKKVKVKPTPIKKHVRVAMVRHNKRPQPVKKVRSPVKKQISTGNTDEVKKMITRARHSPSSTRLSILEQCLRKYGKRCCRAHWYEATYYQGQANIKSAILHLRKYKACTTSAFERNKAELAITRLQGM